MAEFLPIISNSVGTVHMRSMLDHVQIPDLALIEAYRVLQSGGQLIIGMSIEGAPYGESYTKPQIIKLKFAKLLGKLGVKRFSVTHDHHTWHPTLVNLRKLIEDNGFLINEQFWQERWRGRVVFISALKE
jgi:ubiquinone/menaquinone biosynthesis C-methylase UbiE